jgi:hypothetical protein
MFDKKSLRNSFDLPGQLSNIKITNKAVFIATIFDIGV